MMGHTLVDGLEVMQETSRINQKQNQNSSKVTTTTSRRNKHNKDGSLDEVELSSVKVEDGMIQIIEFKSELLITPYEWLLPKFTVMSIQRISYLKHAVEQMQEFMLPH